MAGNLPDGCMDNSDLDYYDRVNRMFCEDREEPEDRCEHCGAGNGEPCDEGCTCFLCQRVRLRNQLESSLSGQCGTCGAPVLGGSFVKLAGVFTCGSCIRKEAANDQV